MKERGTAMIYVIIVLCIICFYLAVRLFYYQHQIVSIQSQMEQLEKNPDTNCQLKADYLDESLDLLMQRINDIYTYRQEERILYQKRELEIRREIENIAHDLRTPLTSIIGYVTLLKEGNLSNEEIQEFYNIIYQRSKVLQGFIKDFYELSRIEAEDYPFVLEDIIVQKVVADTVIAYYNDFEAKGIQVEIDLAESEYHLLTDRIQLNRVINNIVQNALKYSDSLFHIHMKANNGMCELIFENDSVNLTEEIVENVFNRFYSGDTTRNSQSTGLGLSIAKLLVEKMGGTISAQLKDHHFILKIEFIQESHHL